MITYIEGNLFSSPAKTLVNTVNTVGAMGKGIAFEFKNIYPKMFEEYRDLCDTGKFKIGRIWLYKSNNKWILNFPTKIHWRNPSKLEYIEKGLITFVSNYNDMQIDSIAFPPLGCGNGQLDFESAVKPMMEKYLSRLPISIFIYPDLIQEIEAEQDTPDLIVNWLRSDPGSLSFSEVWDDLNKIIRNGNTFNTIRFNTPYIVEINEDSLIIKRNDYKKKITRHTILAFWQQLRDFGYSSREIAPAGLQNVTQYLIPIFAKLSYIQTITISGRFSKLDKIASTGLQYYPIEIKANSQANIFPQLTQK